jgi:hypothetical protein
MAGFLDDFKRGFAQARADTTRTKQRREPAGREPSTPANAADDKETFAETAALAEQLNARVNELETQLAGTAVYGEVLLLPGVKTYLVARFHPDKHRDANETERQGLTENLQKINTAYEALENKGGS